MSARTLIFVLLLSGVGRLFAQENLSDRLIAERLQQTGTAITIIFDDSGSMNADQKLPQAKAAFAKWLKNIPDDTKLSLITFQDGGRIIIPLRPNNRETVSLVVQRIVAASGTPICRALSLAMQQIRERREKITPYERHVVLLFTDGAETQDSRGAEGVRQEIGKLRAANIEVAGVGFHGQGDYMNGVATHYYEANDEASLTRGLAKIDAEIGDSSDIVVSPEELVALRKPAPAPSAASPIEAPPSQPAASASPAEPSSRRTGISPLILFFAGFFLLFIVRSFFRKRR